MSESATALLEQAQICVQLVEDQQLSEALVLLQSLTAKLKQERSSAATSGPTMQKIADLLSEAVLGASALREDSKRQLKRIRSEQKIKAAYADSSLPPYS